MNRIEALVAAAVSKAIEGYDLNTMITNAIDASLKSAVEAAIAPQLTRITATPAFEEMLDKKTDEAIEHLVGEYSFCRDLERKIDDRLDDALSEELRNFDIEDVLSTKVDEAVEDAFRGHEAEEYLLAAAETAITEWMETAEATFTLNGSV